MLSIADLLAGVVLLGGSYFLGSEFALYVAAIVLLKGIYSLVASIAARIYADWMGVLDVAAGAVLFLMISGISVSFYQILGVVMVVKALYTWARVFAGF